VDLMKTHSLTRPFAHCSRRRRRARAPLSPPLYIQNKSRTSNKVVVRLLMELDLPSRTGAGTKRCRQSPENTIPQKFGRDALRGRAHFFVGAFILFLATGEFMIASVL
jgi:hypothetical protein